MYVDVWRDLALTTSFGLPSRIDIKGVGDAREAIRTHLLAPLPGKASLRARSSTTSFLKGSLLVSTHFHYGLIREWIKVGLHWRIVAYFSVKKRGEGAVFSLHEKHE